MGVRWEFEQLLPQIMGVWAEKYCHKFCIKFLSFPFFFFSHFKSVQILPIDCRYDYDYDYASN